MNLSKILTAVAVFSFAALPAAALAEFQVNATGFHRIVADSSQGGSCRVRRNDAGTLVRCPNGSRGTMTVYQYRSGPSVCELDFWYQTNPVGAGRWRVQVSHQNTSVGTCSTHWDNPNTIDLSLKPNS